MTDSITMTREQELLEEFKTGLDKDGPVVLAERVAALEAENKDLMALLNTADQERSGLEANRDALLIERDEAVKRAEQAEASGKKSAAEVKKLTTPAKPRKIGAIDDDKAIEGDVLQEAIDAADTVEIVFSDGVREVAGLAPVAVSGDAWKQNAPFTGLKLTTPIEIEGPAGDTSVSIAGYALLLDGKQVAWCARDMPVQVAPRQRVSISDDIIF